MDDSAMIMRVKFTTPPGEQFVMRKEIFRRLQEAFKKNNIEFAHRNVTVYMPQENDTAQEIPDSSKDSQSVSDKRLKGAAVAGILYEEENTVDDGSDHR